MSLIHNALKKLDTAHPGYRVDSQTVITNRGGHRSKVLAVVLVIVLVTVTAATAVFFFTASSRSTPVKVVSPNATTAVESRLAAPVKSGPVSTDQGLHNYRMGKYRDAESAFRAASELDPTDPRHHNNLGLTLMRLGKKVHAESAFKRALEFKPDYPEALNNYGALLQRTGRPAKAVAMYKKALKSDPQYPDPHLNLAVLFEGQGKTRSAIMHYKSFVELSGSEVLIAGEVGEKIQYLSSGLRRGGG